MPLEMNAEELMAYLEEVFPQVSSDFAVDRLAEMEIDLRLLVGERHLRPRRHGFGGQACLRWPIVRFMPSCWLWWAARRWP